jgi:hypothetical protein
MIAVGVTTRRQPVNFESRLTARTTPLAVAFEGQLTVRQEQDGHANEALGHHHLRKCICVLHALDVRVRLRRTRAVSSLDHLRGVRSLPRTTASNDVNDGFKSCLSVMNAPMLPIWSLRGECETRPARAAQLPSPVVGRGENGDALAVVGNLVAVLLDLMAANNVVCDRVRPHTHANESHTPRLFRSRKLVVTSGPNWMPHPRLFACFPGCVV